MPRSALAVLLVAAACSGKSKSSPPTPAATSCPEPVTATITRTYPAGTLGPCNATRDDGKDVYEVTVTLPDGTIEVELSPDGVITETEQVVTALPDAVATAFAAKYPGETATRIERHTQPGKSDTFEVRFGAKEATFTDAGNFVREEKADADRD